MPLYCLYKGIRVTFVAFWFYFSPFFAMSLQFIIPFFQTIDQNRAAEAADLMAAKAAMAAANTT